MTEQETPLNPASVLERTAQVHDRYKRNVGYLVMLQTRIPILETALKQRKLDLEEATADVIRLEKEISNSKDHANKLVDWVAKNADMPDDIAQANALAEKIRKLQKEIEKKQRELHRVESGLPE